MMLWNFRGRPRRVRRFPNFSMVYLQIVESDKLKSTIITVQIKYEQIVNNELP